MRVLHLISTLDRGGAETQLIQQVNFQKTRGLDVAICFLKGKGSLVEAAKGVSIKKVRGRFFLSQFFAFVFFVRKQKPDLIVAHLPRSELLAAVVSKITRIKFLVTKHNTEQFWPKGNKSISRIMANFVDRSACSTICITRAIQDFLFSIHEANFQKSTVVHYGIQRDDRDNSRTEHTNSQSGMTNIICVARLEPQKNLSILIELIPRIYDINPILEIFGDGSERDTLSFKIQKKKLEDRIKLRGVTDDICLKMRSSDILILPSLYEGLGLVLLEALDQGCLVVASRIPAIEEVLGSDYPLLFNPLSISELEERVREALNVDRSWFSLYRLEVLERFTLEEQFGKTLNVYRSCLEK